MSTNSQAYSLMRIIHRIGILVVAAVVSTACGELFDVENPGNLTKEDLENMTLLPALANTSEGRVCDVYDNLSSANDLQGDGFTFIGSFTFTELFMWGHMEGYNSQYNGLYNDLGSARWVSDDMIRRLKDAVPNPTANRDVARALFWNAIARIALADHFKEVPFDGGAPIKPDVVLEQVLTRLDEAATVAQAANDVGLRAAAIATKARVYRSLYFERNKQLSFFTSAVAAADQALQLQPTLNYVCRYGQPGSENTMANLWVALTGTVLDPRYAVLADPVSGVKDPRIPVGPAEFRAPEPHRGNVHKFYKYPLRDSPLPVARWAEARLILAEGYLLQNNLPAAVTQINMVRTAARLPAFASTDATRIYEQIRYERQAEFVGEGRRLQDHRYYNIIPWQWEEINKQRGTNRRWPVSQEEIAGNKNYGGLG
jgi:hypothetical protein